MVASFSPHRISGPTTAQCRRFLFRPTSGLAGGAPVRRRHPAKDLFHRPTERRLQPVAMADLFTSRAIRENIGPSPLCPRPAGGAWRAQLTALVFLPPQRKVLFTCPM